MSIVRHFLDWSQPALPAAARWLLDRYARAGEADLGQVLLALPVKRAGRRLLELLVELADQRELQLTPPRILTAGELPEQLYQPQHPFADDLTQQLAWMRALRELSRGELAPLLPHPPPAEETSAWLALGQTLSTLHLELAADALDFGDVVRWAESESRPLEVQRWRALVGVQQRYLRTLDELELWDKQTARLVAIRQRECRAQGDIVLLATVDMPRTQRDMLDQVADRVTALVVAPSALAERFDEHGCLLPAAWQEATIPLARGEIEVVDSPGDQADAMLRALARLDGRYAADQITVGAAEVRLVPYLLQRLEESELPARWGVGVPLARTGPARLLADVAEYLEQGSFRAFAALVRHPDVDGWLRAGKLDFDPAAACDRYFAEHLPAQLPGAWRDPHGTDRALRRLHEAIQSLLHAWRRGPLPLADWADAIAELLLAVYGQRDFDVSREADRRLVAACDAVSEVLAGLRQVPASLAPSLSASEALRLAQARLRDALPPRGHEPAIEVLGWLELPLDDAPALVVTGLNEGVVPTSLNADPFLPNQLRRRLQLEDNARRYARDAYALSVLAASRERLHVIAGRRTAEGDPLWPSRLLLACDEGELCRRVLELFGPPPSGRALALPRGIQPARAPIDFSPPRPEPLAEEVRSLRVTEFRDYLSCPYRYYLRHRLGLAAATDQSEELDGRQFGTLLHEAIRGVDRRIMEESTSHEELAAALREALDTTAGRLYGPAPLPAVRLQIEQVRLRLEALARWQADWRRDGWRIAYVEQDISAERASLDVDGTPIGLRGRIDRIDRHLRSGEYVVFDYKSGDEGKKPDQAHRLKDRWIDLQLPLYRHLARGLGIDGPVKLAFIVLPKDVAQTTHHLAPWNDAELAGADEAAREVVRGIRRQLFWPPRCDGSALVEEFAAVCGDHQLATRAVALSVDEEQEP